MCDSVEKYDTFTMGCFKAFSKVIMRLEEKEADLRVQLVRVSKASIELYKRGYTEEDIEKIWGKNLIRVMTEVEQHALKQNPTQ